VLRQQAASIGSRDCAHLIADALQVRQFLEPVEGFILIQQHGRIEQAVGGGETYKIETAALKRHT